VRPVAADAPRERVRRAGGRRRDAAEVVPELRPRAGGALVEGPAEAARGLRDDAVAEREPLDPARGEGADGRVVGAARAERPGDVVVVDAPGAPEPAVRLLLQESRRRGDPPRANSPGDAGNSARHGGCSSAAHEPSVRARRPVASGARFRPPQERLLWLPGLPHRAAPQLGHRARERGAAGGGRAHRHGRRAHRQLPRERPAHHQGARGRPHRHRGGRGHGARPRRPGARLPPGARGHRGGGRAPGGVLAAARGGARRLLPLLGRPRDARGHRRHHLQPPVARAPRRVAAAGRRPRAPRAAPGQRRAAQPGDRRHRRGLPRHPLRPAVRRARRFEAGAGAAPRGGRGDGARGLVRPRPRAPLPAPRARLPRRPAPPRAAPGLAPQRGDAARFLRGPLGRVGEVHRDVRARRDDRVAPQRAPSTCSTRGGGAPTSTATSSPSASATSSPASSAASR
jgi:hypothetical protein